MKALPFSLLLAAVLVAPVASAEPLEEAERLATSRWVGGMGLTTSIGSHLAGIGATAVARYAFVQAGLMGYTGVLGAGGFGTLGVVGTVGQVEVGLEAMFGSQRTDTGPLMDLQLFGSCQRTDPEVTATTAGAVLSLSRSLRAGGVWIGGGGWLAKPVRTTRYSTTSTCTSTPWFGDGSETTSTTTSTETIGASGGLFFRIGFGIL